MVPWVDFPKGRLLMGLLLDTLGYVGDSADKLGGRAVRGLLGGNTRELLSVVPFSDRIGLTDESEIVRGADLAGGNEWLGFGMEMALDPSNYLGFGLIDDVGRGGKLLGKMAEGSSKIGRGGFLEDAWGKASKFMGDESGSLKIPDPLEMYAPWANMKVVSDELRNAANWVGPQYPGGIDKLRGVFATAPSAWERPHHSKLDQIVMARDPDVINRLAGEIPDGSRYLGNGFQAWAFEAPDGSVIRLSPGYDNVSRGADRANIPEIVQPYRFMKTNPLDPKDSFNIEHLPRVAPMERPQKDLDDLHAMLAMQLSRLGDNIDTSFLSNASMAEEAVNDINQLSRKVSGTLSNRIEDTYGAGPNPTYYPQDWHPGNVSWNKEGRGIGHDASLAYGAKNKKIIRPSPIQPASLDLIREAEMLGGSEAVRKAMSEGLAGTSSLGGLDMGDLHGRWLDSTNVIDNFMKQNEGLRAEVKNLSHADREDLRLKGLIHLLKFNNKKSLPSGFTPQGSGVLEFADFDLLNNNNAKRVQDGAPIGTDTANALMRDLANAVMKDPPGSRPSSSLYGAGNPGSLDSEDAKALNDIMEKQAAVRKARWDKGIADGRYQPLPSMEEINAILKEKQRARMAGEASPDGLDEMFDDVEAFTPVKSPISGEIDKLFWDFMGDESGSMNLKAIADFPMAKFKQGQQGDQIARIVGSGISPNQRNFAIDQIKDMMNVDDLAGAYWPLIDDTVTLPVKDALHSGGIGAVSPTLPAKHTSRVARHERTHGIIDRAVKSGQTDGLPLAFKIPAQLANTGFYPLAQEVGAHIGEMRGPMAQAANLAKFLFDPESVHGYSQQFASSPESLAAFKAIQYLPAALKASGLSVQAMLRLLSGPSGPPPERKVPDVDPSDPYGLLIP